MCEITIDNFDLKFQEISYNLQKANFIGKKTQPLNCINNFKLSLFICMIYRSYRYRILRSSSGTSTAKVLILNFIQSEV